MTGAVRRLRRLTRRWERGRGGLLRWTVLGSVLMHSLWLASLRLLTPVSPPPDVVVWQLERLVVDAAPSLAPLSPTDDDVRYIAASQPEARPPDDVQAISSRDQAASEARRQPTPHRDLGPTARHQLEGAHPGGQRTTELSGGATSTLRGGPTGPADSLATGHRGGGGHLGPSPGRGAPTPPGTSAGGASQRGARSPHERARLAQGQPFPRQLADSPWWQPTVQRRLVTGAPAEGPVDTTPQPGSSPAVAPSLHRRPRSPRPVQVVAQEPPAPTAPAPTPGTERHRVAKPMGDPIAELRQALGLGVLDRGKLAPRPQAPGHDYAEGAPSTSPRAPMDLPTSWTSEVAARGTPLGRWIEQAEARIVERWTGLDLSAHDRARGIQGDVIVRYRVESGGRVTRVEVERSSGLPELDSMAVAAIPDRLPRLPRSAGRDAFVHRVTLRYRNPLLTLTPSL